MVEVTADAVRPVTCPGTKVAELPALIAAKTTVPPEYVMHRIVLHWLGARPGDPFDVRTFPEKATVPELALIMSQEKPEAIAPATADIVMGLLQTRIALLCTVAQSRVRSQLNYCPFPQG